MPKTILKNILGVFGTGTFLVALYVYGISTHSILTFLAAVLIAFVFARNVLIKESWYQTASTIVAALFVPGTFVNFVVHAHADADIQVFAVLLFNVFLVRTSLVGTNKAYKIIVRISLFLSMLGLGYLLIFPPKSEVYLYPNSAYAVFTVLSTFLLLVYAFITDEHQQYEVRIDVKEQNTTIDWFSTLVNLVSHNLRSPLATILGNIQLLVAKHPSTRNSLEIQRIENSVNTANEILDRLLKATFVTDRNSQLNIEESLKLAYPGLTLIGAPEELTYEESVSILLSLEVFLDNAFRFSPENVMLTFRDSRIEIRDYGKGISKDQIEAFGHIKDGAIGSLHGIGIPFAIRILDTIGYSVTAENSSPGLLVKVFPNSANTPPPLD